MNSNMQSTIEAGTEFWNESCSIRELTEAVAEGAVGATLNPAMFSTVARYEPDQWLEPLDKIIRDNPCDTEDEISWKLLETAGVRAAQLLLPAFQQSAGMKGRLSIQVNTKFYRDPGRMLRHAVALSSLAPNIAVMLPCTDVGLTSIEEATAAGICVNATVSFTIPQALAAAECIERGFARRKNKRVDFIPFVTILMGRLDDYLKRIAAKESAAIDPAMLEWAGIAVFKKAYGIFKSRGYRAKLVAAAYRNHRHWSEFVGGNVIVSIPYEWWRNFNVADNEVRNRIAEPVDPAVVRQLQSTFRDFRAAFDEGELTRPEFVRFGPTVSSLRDDLAAYERILEFVRDRMLR